jgi:hypothetical protein
VLQYTLRLIICPCRSHSINRMPSTSQNTESIRRCCPKFLWARTVIVFPMSGLPSGLIICNQCGKELLLVLLVKSKQLLAFLHPSVFYLGVRSLRTQCAQTFFTLKCSWIMHGLLPNKKMLPFAVYHWFCSCSVR